jgi:LL-diaminopimelate aminotransferase
MGFDVYGGTDAPYVFIGLNGTSSWDMFQTILDKAQVVTIPGAGFGPGGEGFLRLSAFAPRDKIEEALNRIEEAGIRPPMKESKLIAKSITDLIGNTPML